MSSRLHNKFHRHNHHTVPIEDARYPDASHDPIASHESPFLGDFILQGSLSAIGGATFTAPITCEVQFTGDILQIYEEPIFTSGEFLIVNLNGERRAIRLWNIPE
jgi:hypothetical protein